MSADVQIGEGARLAAHPLRAAVLGEVHARPFTPIETPRRILHFAFDTAGERAAADRAAFAAFCKGRGLAALQASDKQHRVALGGSVLRWEQHSEFTTYTWELPAEAPEAAPFHPSAATLASPMASLPQPGPFRRDVGIREQMHIERHQQRAWRIPTAARCSRPISRPIPPASCASW